jgi:hypothetical protein
MVFDDPVEWPKDVGPQKDLIVQSLCHYESCFQFQPGSQSEFGVKPILQTTLVRECYGGRDSHEFCKNVINGGTHSLKIRHVSSANASTHVQIE